MLPADIPEIMSYPNVSAFVARYLSMQVGDVRSMMRLPLPALGIGHACNFASAATLCNLVSGLSVTVFMPANPVSTKHRGKNVWIGTGLAFKQIVQDFYPWDPTDNKHQRAKVLYDLVRNPFAHALGVRTAASPSIDIARLKVVSPQGEQSTGLTESQLEEIERSATRPGWLPPGISGSAQKWTLVAEGFYRDIFH